MPSLSGRLAMRFTSAAVLILTAFAFAGGVQPSFAQDKGKGTLVKVGKLSATTPADWQKEKPANLLRSYQFKLPGAEDFPQPELAIFPESHPDPEKNFPKWKAQFVPPEG